jgi:O-antigen/teichoic acid export membrane protein
MVIIKIYFVLVGVTFSFYPLALYTLLSGSLQVFVNFALLNYKMKQTGDKYFYLSMSSSILRIGLGLFFVIYMLKGIEGRFLGQLLGFIVVAVISIVSLVGYNSEKLKKLFTFNLDFKSIIRFSLPLVFLGYLDYPLIYLDKILLERLGNNVQFALYNLGSSFSGFLFAFGSAIFQSVEPDLYKHASNENYHSFAKIMILILILVIIVNLVFMFFSPYLTGYLTRYKYTDSYKYANILCWNNLVLLLSYGLGIILITKEKTMLSLKIKIFVSILAIIILYLFIVKFDFYGAAYAKILVNVIYVITMVFIIFREVNKRPNLKTETLTVK